MAFALMLALAPAGAVAADWLPSEPLEIGGEPQFVFDNYVIDNVWAIKYKSQSVERRFHAPEKYAGNPIIDGHAGYVCVRRDPVDGRFRMWYQTHEWLGEDVKGSQYGIRYAESDDGLKWTLPNLGLVDWGGSRDNNVVLGGGKDRYSGPFLIDAPEQDRRGFKYILLHSSRNGLELIGSQDGIRWDPASRTQLKHMHSDTQNSIVYDPRGKQYLMFCRAKHIYRTFQGDIIDTGESRRVARLANKELWGPWEGDPQNILLPDDVDYADGKFNAFYGMQVRHYGGVFFGALQRFRFNDEIHTHLAFSRDGARFERLPDRPKLIALGPEGSWDDGMVFGSIDWVEMGDEWWIYYSGSDGPHASRDRETRVGVAKMRKEGFISMHGPAGGGVLVTRLVRWPGGSLIVNATATGGELRVRVTDERRKKLDGLDYGDCDAFTGDAVSHAVTWGGRSLDSLAGQVVRLEFLLNEADLYTFRAAAKAP